MRGLAFPSNPPADRETSYEYGTPNAQGDDIPIDPALGIAAIDPALMEHPGRTNDLTVSWCFHAFVVGTERVASLQITCHSVGY